MSEYGESQAERDYRIKKENDKLRRNYDNKQASVAYYQEVEKKMDEDWKRKLEEEDALRPKISEEQKKKEIIKQDVNHLMFTLNTINGRTLKLSSNNIKTKSVEVTESGGKKKTIDVPSFHVYLKFDIIQGKFYILRWGDWREFDPIKYLIKVDFNESREDGINPFTKKIYKGNTDKYHTVLRKIKDKSKSLYYSIIDKTFYKEEDTCKEVFKYQKGGGVCNFNSTLDRDWTFKEANFLSRVFFSANIITDEEYRDDLAKSSMNKSVTSKTILKKNEEDRDYLEFMNPFVNEFGGVMDEMLEYGYSFILSDERNLAEELIWGNDSDKLQTRNNYRTGGGSGEELLYESIKLSDEDTMRNIITTIIFTTMTNYEYTQFEIIDKDILSLDKQISKFDLTDREDRTKVELFLRIFREILDKEKELQDLREVLKRKRIYINVDELRNRKFEEFLVKFTDTDGKFVGRKMTSEEYDDMQTDENFVSIVLGRLIKLFNKWHKLVDKERIKNAPLRRSKETFSRK